MNNLISRISSLRVNDLIVYLKRNQWSLDSVRSRNKNLLLFTGHEDDYGNSIELILPSNDELQETKIRILEAIKLIAAVENRSMDEVIESIRSKSKDVLSARIVNESLRSGSIPLETAQELIGNLRNLLLCAAKMERHPSPFYSRIRSKDLEGFIGRCRLGQTFVGSFGFRIEIPIPASVGTNSVHCGPLPNDLSEEDKKEATPFERRVMLRIFRGLSMIEESISNDNAKNLIEDYEEGFNANIYELLQRNFVSIPEVSFDYSISWSPDWPVPENIGKVKKIHLGSDSYRFIETAADRLRKTCEPEHVTIRGYIIQLRAEYIHEESNDNIRAVIIRRTELQKSPIKVRFNLDVGDYKKACEAHKNNQMIEVKGKLIKPGKYWELDSPADLKIV